MKVVVTDYDMLTAYGHGIQACWDGLLSGRSALREVERLNISSCRCKLGGSVAGIESMASHSASYQLIDLLFSDKKNPVPEGAPLLLATTNGEVDLIERSVFEGREDYQCGALSGFLNKVCQRLDARWGAEIISSACISSTAAVARAASMIRSGEHDACIVVRCDALTEFVFSGFSSLMALDEKGAHPFDANRRGLCLGEGAAYAVLMSEERALREGSEVRGEVAGWGLSNDANHMTGPSRDGSGLARAIAIALRLSGIEQDQVSSICAHGTGTQYNDAMEMLAFKKIFSNCRPVYSIKGGTGHTMGAAGVIELLILLKSLESGIAPPTLGLMDVDEVAAGWVSTCEASLKEGWALTSNSGFGGVNAALIVGKGVV